MFCDLVVANAQNTSSALHAGLRYCQDITTFGEQIFGEFWRMRDDAD